MSKKDKETIQNLFYGKSGRILTKNIKKSEKSNFLRTMEENGKNAQR